MQNTPRCVWRANARHYLFLGRHRPHVSHERIEIRVCHFGIVGEAHRAFERSTVLTLTLRDRSLDFGVGPIADSCSFVRRDVARCRDTPRAWKLAAPFSERTGEVAAAA